ncbi:MAG: ABC transporter permease subunit [Geminicoccaceae bacterium]|nr:ABC transporter permease subunit [Geminicoccaceae bacterium]MCS7266785.1 ABC transporter permease subunit [Geminicoccaceae bacterium]MCX7630524.1 ABC transporter permease subunit [Geminicoccaceae bacterium]MDW8123806.1 ABC transporter permease subunit [Geminicoccaceae bacterium]MDW8341596.1 ABC transporter permease subunit [Geminicoccaceae bacterium]
MRLVNRRPGREAALVLSLLPFLLLVLAYLWGSAVRLAENPADKLLPWPSTILETLRGLAFEPDRRTGQLVFWADTLASLGRLGSGLAIAAATGAVLGLAIGLIPIAGALLSSFAAAAAMIPPLAILPILLIVLGTGEASKIGLVALGTAPVLVRDVALRVRDLPEELLVKAQTLGASTWHLAARIAAPLVAPRLLDALRLQLGPAWLFLIAAEAIAATEGLGYRIFLVRRYLAMDVILPYVAWITLLAFAGDRLLAWIARRLFPWAKAGA